MSPPRITLDDRVRRWMREAIADAVSAAVRGSTSVLLDADGSVNRYALAEACAAAMGLDISDEDVAELLWDAAFDVHDETSARRSA